METTNVPPAPEATTNDTTSNANPVVIDKEIEELQEEIMALEQAIESPVKGAKAPEEQRVSESAKPAAAESAVAEVMKDAVAEAVKDINDVKPAPSSPNDTQQITDTTTNNNLKSPPPTNNENAKPASTTKANFEELGNELGNPTGSDVVLVPVDPRLSAPSIATEGSRLEAHIDRRKRLFSAKRFFACEANLPRRKKRVAKKSLSRTNSKVKSAEWDDYFHTHPPKQPTTTALPPSTTTTAKPKAKAKAHKKAKVAKPRFSGPSPIEVYRGPPDEDMSEYGGWPPGWIKSLIERQGGTTKGTKDRYWFSPGGNKFRSMKEVKKFLKALQMSGGVEDQAKKIWKSVSIDG